MPTPIIDLFAGPGGLGEGFSSLLKAGKRVFKIGLSIEMDEHAHRTLELRAFYREFQPGSAPREFYDYIAGRISRDALFERHKHAATRARVEAWHAELGGKCAPDSLVDERITTALGDSRKPWVLIGGPPCQAYSLAGRSRVIGDGSGREKYESDHRHHLYRHYLRILAVHRPQVFVMENVKGLLSAKVDSKGMFERILADLKQPMSAFPNLGVARKDFGYKLFPLTVSEGEVIGDFAPSDFVIHAEDHGIPQARHRIIILGIRNDLEAAPDLLASVDPVTVEQVLNDLPRLRSGLSKEDDSAQAWKDAVRDITAARWLGNDSLEPRLRDALVRNAQLVNAILDRGSEFISRSAEPERHASWYCDPKLKGVCNHTSRGHIRTDLHRYFFAAVFAQVYGRSPLLEDLPRSLLPKHDNVEDALKETKFNDRFRVQLAERPSTTVVSHISKDGHYYIHYDPTQCRSLTVREAARLQTFPDNYFFEGPRTEQYKQVGNAVPPLLARQIAEIVAKLLK